MGFLFGNDRNRRDEEPSLFDVMFGTSSNRHSERERRGDGDGETVNFSDGLGMDDMLDEMDDLDIDDIDP